MSKNYKPFLTADEKVLADFLTMTCGRFSPDEDEELYRLINILIQRSVEARVEAGGDIGWESFYPDSLERCEAMRNAATDAMEKLGIPLP